MSRSSTSLNRASTAVRLHRTQGGRELILTQTLETEDISLEAIEREIDNDRLQIKEKRKELQDRIDEKERELKRDIEKIYEEEEELMALDAELMKKKKRIQGFRKELRG